MLSNKPMRGEGFDILPLSWYNGDIIKKAIMPTKRKTNVNNKIGIVYLIETDSQPEMFKIGSTSGDNPSEVDRRMKELYSTGVALPYTAFKASLIEGDYEAIERKIHIAADEWIVNPRREFFWDECRLLVELLLEGYETKDVTPFEDLEDQPEVASSTKARSRYQRAQNKLLTSVYDYGHIFTHAKHPSETAMFVESDNNNTFERNGIVKSYSGLALDILQEFGHLSDHTVSGSKNWVDEDGILIEKRFADLK